MRVLSIKQPFATLIVRGVKRYEARTWRTDHCGRIAMHASSGFSPDIALQWDESEVLGDAFAQLGWLDEGDPRDLPRMAVVGTIGVLDVQSAKVWWPQMSPLDKALVIDGPADEPPDDLFLWRLADPAEIKPIATKGRD